MKFLLTIISTGAVFMTGASALITAPTSFLSFACTPASSSSSSLYSSSSSSPGPLPRIIREELPIVYVYDHCPFCVRVRLALGIKNIKHTVVFLQNDDIKTPTKLIGKKIAPIFVSLPQCPRGGVSPNLIRGWNEDGPQSLLSITYFTSLLVLVAIQTYSHINYLCMCFI